MREVTLERTDLTVSRLIFGTASLFSAGRIAARGRLLDAAADHGFTHFDTAPLYGFGSAERDLRALLKRRPSLTVTSKVGLYAPGGEDQPHALVFARKVLGRGLSPLSRARADVTIARARRSLDASLRRLGRDRIELYLLHDPDPALLAADEWQRWLENELRAGRVGYAGVAGDAEAALGMAAIAPSLTRVLQVGATLDGDGAARVDARLHPPQITYGYLRAALRAGAADAKTVLARALARRPAGAVLVGTRRIERLAELAAAAA